MADASTAGQVPTVTSSIDTAASDSPTWSRRKGPNCPSSGPQLIRYHMLATVESAET